MEKRAVEIMWQFKKIVIIESHSDEGALEKAQNEQPEESEVVKDSMSCRVLK